MGFHVKRIEIYPYGGCSKLEYPINISLWKEFLVLLMGPITQILFVLFVSFLKWDVEPYFFVYHWFILGFNLLPIYPLDGGRILNLICAYFVSYYQSLKQVFYFSYLFYILLLFITLLWKKNLVLFLILGLLGMKLKKEIKYADYSYEKFLMERYLNTYSFHKSKKITNIKQMRRDYYHYFLKEGRIITEKEYLNTYFARFTFS